MPLEMVTMAFTVRVTHWPDGDTQFPLIDIPKAPLHSLVQLSGANIGTRLFEPTHAIGNSWKPPYVPWGFDL